MNWRTVLSWELPKEGDHSFFYEHVSSGQLWRMSDDRGSYITYVAYVETKYANGDIAIIGASGISVRDTFKIWKRETVMYEEGKDIFIAKDRFKHYKLLTGAKDFS